MTRRPNTKLYKTVFGMVVSYGWGIASHSHWIVPGTWIEK